MSSETRQCPKCGTQMMFRLGEFECPSCGYIEPAKRAEDERSSGGPGIKRSGAGSGRLSPGAGGPAGQAPPPEQFSMLRSAGIRETSGDTGRLSAEKTLFLTIYFAYQLLSSFLIVTLYEGAASGVVSLPGLLVGAVFSTLGVGFVLYFDNDCLRQCCMWSLAPIVILASWSVIMSFATGQGGLSLTLIPNIVLSGWLFSILLRDRRSE